MYAFLLSALIFFVTPGCAYHFGLSERSLPGGYGQVSIPMFKNKSAEVGIEPLFTNSLITHFERSRAAHVVDKDGAPAVLEGTITNVNTSQGAVLDSGNLPTLPAEAVLVSNYRLQVSANIVLRRKSDDKIIWQGSFTNEKVYSSPIIGTALVNSADATYNQSARIQAIGLLAEEMMTEAHDRITENY